MTRLSQTRTETTAQVTGKMLVACPSPAYLRASWAKQGNERLFAGNPSIDHGPGPYQTS